MTEPLTQAPFTGYMKVKGIEVLKMYPSKSHSLYSFLILLLVSVPFSANRYTDRLAEMLKGDRRQDLILGRTCFYQSHASGEDA